MSQDHDPNSLNARKLLRPGRLEEMPPPPKLTIGLNDSLMHGVAEQLRVLADLIDPPVAEAREAQ